MQTLTKMGNPNIAVSCVTQRMDTMERWKAAIWACLAYLSIVGVNARGYSEWGGGVTCVLGTGSHTVKATDLWAAIAGDKASRHDLAPWDDFYSVPPDGCTNVPGFGWLVVEMCREEGTRPDRRATLSKIDIWGVLDGVADHCSGLESTGLAQWETVVRGCIGQNDAQFNPKELGSIDSLKLVARNPNYGRRLSSLSASNETLTHGRSLMAVPTFNNRGPFYGTLNVGGQAYQMVTILGSSYVALIQERWFGISNRVINSFPWGQVLSEFERLVTEGAARAGAVRVSTGMNMPLDNIGMRLSMAIHTEVPTSITGAMGPFAQRVDLFDLSEKLRGNTGDIEAIIILLGAVMDSIVGTEPMKGFSLDILRNVNSDTSVRPYVDGIAPGGDLVRVASIGVRVATGARYRVRRLLGDISDEFECAP